VLLRVRVGVVVGWVRMSGGRGGQHELYTILYTVVFNTILYTVLHQVYFT
jgi:hypothetical protein